MSNTIRLRPCQFRTPQHHQRVVAGGWKNRALDKELIEGNYADKYSNDEGTWLECDDEHIWEDHHRSYQPGWLERSQVRRAKLRVSHVPSASG